MIANNNIIQIITQERKCSLYALIAHNKAGTLDGYLSTIVLGATTKHSFNDTATTLNCIHNITIQH